MISPFFAGNALLFLMGLLLIFHCLVLAGVIPSGIVWAGKIADRKELIKMESISLVILGFAAIVVALKMGYLNFLKNTAIPKVGMWVLFAFFVLNTIGNLTAKSPVEKYGFGFLTLVMACLAWRLAMAPS